jgi:hypothetical protein
MSDCGVCIGSDDYERGEFYCAVMRKARKTHRCCECREDIPARGQYEHASGRWDDGIETYKTCASCVAIRTAFTCNGGFIFTSLWDDMREFVFPILTTANECLRKLTPADRARVIRKWQAWKGLVSA